MDDKTDKVGYQTLTPEEVTAVRAAAKEARPLVLQNIDALLEGQQASIAVYPVFNSGSPAGMDWQAAVVYRVHVADSPSLALRSLIQTTLGAEAI